jgi:hypothetical protein
LRCNRAGAGIGDRLAEKDVAGFAQNAENSEQRGMSARCDENAILRRNQRATPEPGGRRVLVGGRTAKSLIAQQRNQIAADFCEARLHALDQSRFVRFRRQVHRKIDDLGAAWA